MATRTGSASTGAFARLASLALAGKKAEEDEKEQDKATDDKEDEKASDEEKDDESGKKADDKEDEKAADKKDGDGECAEDDDEDEKAAEDDEDEDEDEDDKKGKKARRAERKRIASIITSPAASRSQAHLANAMYLALETGMSAKSAIGMLMCMPASSSTEESGNRAARQAARARLDSTPNPKISDDPSTGGPNMAAQIIAAGKKRRGEA